MIKNNYISLRNNNNNSTFTCNSKKLRENNNSPHQHYPNNNNNHSKYDIHVIIEEEKEQSYLKEGNINNNNHYKKNQLRQNQKPKDLQNNPFQILSEIERNTYIKELSQFYEEKVKLLKEENIQLNKELENSNQTLQFLSEENSILRSSLLTLQDEKKKIKLLLKRKEKELEKYLEKGFNLSINKTGSEIISTINNNTIHNNNKTTNLNSSKNVCKEIKSGSGNSSGSDKKRRDRGTINSLCNVSSSLTLGIVSTGAVTDTDTCKEEEEVDKEKKELRKTIEQLKILLLEEEKKQQALHASKQTVLNSNNNNNMNHNNKKSNINMMNNNSSNNNTKNNMTDPIFTEYFLKKDFKNHSNLNNNSTCVSDGKNVNSFVMDVDRVQELEDKFEQLLLVKKELENKLLKREEQLFEMTNKYEGLRKTINKR